MIYNYCTLFDSNYLPKGLALYSSLVSCCDNFHIYVLAFDESCYSHLKSLNLDHITLISLNEFETEELLLVKPTRTIAEYCWTCSPSLIYYTINKYKLDHCTYLDADLMFYTSPDSIYKEIGDSSTAITEHFTNDDIGGKFCVQFVYFKNNTEGLEALIWWKNKCIDWCYAKYENGKFGDQKYLDDFPILFKNVHIIGHRGAGVAPWNLHLYSFSEYGKFTFENNVIEIIFFHYHGTRIEYFDKKLLINIITSDSNSSIEQFIYIPYLKLLKSIFYSYLNKDVTSIKVKNRSFFMKVFFMIKKKLRNSVFIQFIYYKILDNKYFGKK